MPTEPKKKKNRRTGLSRLLRLAKKELVEILRDRRTIITLVLMPLLLYPLLGITVQKFLLNSLTSPLNEPFRIGVDTDATAVDLNRILSTGSYLIEAEKARVKRDGDSGESKRAPDPSQPETPNGNPAVPDPTDPDSDWPRIFAPEDENTTIDQLLEQDEIDVGIRTVGRDQIGRPTFEIILREDSKRSTRATQWLVDHFTAVNLRDGQQILRAMRNRPTAVYSKRVIETDEKPDSSTPSLLAFIPLMLVLMTMTGAVYPAIDLTAGERERGTMEILVSAPVSRMALLFGKFVAVLAVAMLTAIFNLTAMVITLYSLGLEKFVFGEAGLQLPVMFTVLGLLLVFAGFFSATLLGLTSFARSFKEAQAYLIPLMLVSLVPGMLSLMPNVELTPLLAIVPLVNIVMLSRDLLEGTYTVPLAGIVVFSTVFYGFLALGIAARIFGADSMLSGGGSSWSDFFRRPSEIKPRPEISTAMFFLAVLFPSFIVIGSFAGRFGASIDTKLVLNAGVTFNLFVVLPILFTLVFRTRLQSSFLFYPPTIVGVLAAILLGSSVWMLAYELEVMTLSESRIDEMVKMFESTLKFELGELSLPLKLACLAIVPAVCEEFTFRGFLMSAFRKRVHAVFAVLITAVLFGLFHVFVRDSLMFERMLPSTLMGILLGAICLRTGSVIPGILLHVLHNGLLISLSHYESSLSSMGLNMAEQKHLPVLWIACGLAPIAIGLILLYLHPKPADTDDAEEVE